MLVVFYRFRYARVERSNGVISGSLRVWFRFRDAIPIFGYGRYSPVRPRDEVGCFFIGGVFSYFVMRVFIFYRRRFRSFRATLLTRIRFSIYVYIFTAVCDYATGKVIQIVFVRPMVFVGCEGAEYLSK